VHIHNIFDTCSTAVQGCHCNRIILYNSDILLLNMSKTDYPSISMSKSQITQAIKYVIITEYLELSFLLFLVFKKVRPLKKANNLSLCYKMNQLFNVNLN